MSTTPDNVPPGGYAVPELEPLEAEPQWTRADNIESSPAVAPSWASVPPAVTMPVAPQPVPGAPLAVTPPPVAGVNQFGTTPTFGTQGAPPWQPTGRPWTPPESVAQQQVLGMGVSSDLNRHAHVAIAAAIVSIVLQLIMWFGLGSYWWLNLMVAGVAIWFGVKGHNAANRGLATNAGAARASIVVGAVGVLGTVANFVVTVVTVASMV